MIRGKHTQDAACCGDAARWRWVPHRRGEREADLVVHLVEGVLQLAVDGGQLLEVPVGLVDGQQDLVDLVYGLVHGGLRRGRRDRQKEERGGRVESQGMRE